MIFYESKKNSDFFLYKRFFQSDDHKNVIKEYLIKVIIIGKIEITIFKNDFFNICSIYKKDISKKFRETRARV